MKMGREERAKEEKREKWRLGAAVSVEETEYESIIKTTLYQE
jgi:hypothetical protein